MVDTPMGSNLAAGHTVCRQVTTDVQDDLTTIPIQHDEYVDANVANEDSLYEWLLLTEATRLPPWSAGRTTREVAEASA